MAENIQLHGGIVFSQQVLTALIVEAEWPRERAYRAVQAARRSRSRRRGPVPRPRRGRSGHRRGAVGGDDRPLLRRRAVSRAHRRDLPPSWTLHDNNRSGAAGRRVGVRRRGRHRRREDELMQVLSSADIGGLEPVPPRQGARHLPARRRHAVDDRDRSSERVRCRPADTDPRQGHRAHADVAVVVRADQGDHAEPPARRRGGRRSRRRFAPTGCLGRCTSRVRSGSMSSASCAASSADRGGRNIARRERSRASRSRPGLRDSSRLPSPRFTPAIKKDDGHDVNISRQELRPLVGPSSRISSSRRRCVSSISQPRDARASASTSRTRNSSSASSTGS